MEKDSVAHEHKHAVTSRSSLGARALWVEKRVVALSLCKVFLISYQHYFIFLLVCTIGGFLYGCQ